jgi:hypothetical protein
MTVYVVVVLGDTDSTALVPAAGDIEVVGLQEYVPVLVG